VTTLSSFNTHSVKIFFLTFNKCISLQFSYLTTTLEWQNQVAIFLMVFIKNDECVKCIGFQWKWRWVFFKKIFFSSFNFVCFLLLQICFLSLLLLHYLFIICFFFKSLYFKSWKVVSVYIFVVFVSLISNHWLWSWYNSQFIWSAKCLKFFKVFALFAWIC
jgi:hypothetical protein